MRPDAASPTTPGSSGAPATPKGRARREAILDAAVALVLESGPAALAHRVVAARAGVPLGSTTYYFRDLTDLAGAVGQRLMNRWSEHARHVAAGPDHGPEALVAAVLPPGDDAAVLAHYEHLLGAARAPALAAALARGRAELDDAVGQVLATRSLPLTPALAVALVDGAAVAALSEGRPVRVHARDVVRAALG